MKKFIAFIALCSLLAFSSCASSQPTSAGTTKKSERKYDLVLKTASTGEEVRQISSEAFGPDPDIKTLKTKVETALSKYSG
ncbi:MAG TPA: hypothetical protein P5044_08030, partial [bacterium]|nr:hypothetical protein [bacterium]